MSTYPALAVAAQFTSGVWTDITAYVRSGGTSRTATRQAGPLWQAMAGTCSLVLKNGDGRFDPDNLAGPYTVTNPSVTLKYFTSSGTPTIVTTTLSGTFSAVRPGVPLRVQATWNGVSYPLFYGYVDTWGDDGANYGGRYSQVTVSATDAQKVLSAAELATLISPVGAGEDSGARVTRILSAVGWDASLEAVDTGNSALQATSYGTDAWSLLQLTADSELGDLYVAASGKVTFRRRRALMEDARSATPQAVFGDIPGTVQTAGTELAYARVSRASDDTTLAQQVQITRANGTAVQESDATSGGSFNDNVQARTYSRSDLLMQTDPDAANYAAFTAYIGGQPEVRFDTLTLLPRRDPANLFPQALGREMGDRIQVWRRPPGVASPVTRDCFIRGIVHAFDAPSQSWQTDFTLASATKYGSFWTLGNATLGQLGSNAYAY